MVLMMFWLFLCVFGVVWGLGRASSDGGRVWWEVVAEVEIFDFVIFFEKS